MVNRPKAPDDVVAHFTPLLMAAMENVARIDAEQVAGLDARDELICEALDAGISAPRLREIIGLSIARLYQIYQQRGGEAARQRAAAGKREVVNE